MPLARFYLNHPRRNMAMKGIKLLASKAARRAVARSVHRSELAERQRCQHPPCRESEYCGWAAYCGAEDFIGKALHPETRQLVNDFAMALADKLAKAEQKYGYHDNWRTDEWESGCRTELMRHIEKGDPLDVAAYCAFMWRRGWSTSAQ